MSWRLSVIGVGLLLALAGLAGTARAAPADSAPALTAYQHKAQQVATQVLAGREFADLRPAGPSWWDSFQAWLGRLFAGIGRMLARLPLWVVWLAVIWMLLALLAILAHLVYTVAVALRGSRAGAAVPNQVAYGKELLGVRDLQFDSVYQRALQLLGQRRWEQATRHLYVAAILLLDRYGAIRFYPAKTNHDYLRELDPRPSQQAGFSRLTHLFEAMAYGGGAPSGSVCQEMARLLETMHHEVASAAAR